MKAGDIQMTSAGSGISHRCVESIPACVSASGRQERNADTRSALTASSTGIQQSLADVRCSSIAFKHDSDVVHSSASPSNLVRTFASESTADLLQPVRFS